jgi:hypothetical protein
MRSICGELDAEHLLNDMHDVGGIWKVAHSILTSLVNLVPYVSAKGELGQIITKAVENYHRITSHHRRITALGKQDVAKDIVQHIEIWLQPHCLIAWLVTLEEHVLIFQICKHQKIR